MDAEAPPAVHLDSGFDIEDPVLPALVLSGGQESYVEEVTLEFLFCLFFDLSFF